MRRDPIVFRVSTGNTDTAPGGIVYPVDKLLPAAWRPLAEAGPVRTFNPGLLRDGAGWLFAYRVVATDGQRRIGICRLDTSFRVVRDSQVPLSDCLVVGGTKPLDAYPEVARSWFADPRLYRFGQRLFIYWNTGWHEPLNHQFLQELDPRSLAPLGPARELVLNGFVRQKLEKNWTLFGTDCARVFAVYSITPHRVLATSLETEGDIVFEDVAVTPLPLGDFPPCHGGLRGGAPPQWTGHDYLSFCHSVHDGVIGYRYAAAAYRFSATAPFAPTHRPVMTLPLHNPFGGQRVYPALNPAVGEVIYPCGAARDGDRWLVSHGINDEHCAISFIDDARIEATLTEVTRRE